MVIEIKHPSRARGYLMIEIIVALAILALALVPLAYSVGADNRLFRATYQRAVAMEIVDGEMEILAAGEWQSLAAGTHDYTIHARAAANLPPGRFQVTRRGRQVRLEWTANEKSGIGTIVREATLK